MMHDDREHHRGFTLVELLVSMSVAAVLMAGLASAMVLASRAIPDPKSPLISTVNGFQSVEGIANDLYTAQGFSERTTTAVTFSVADRDGDAMPETIRYAWSGVPGTPLTRQYNDRTPVTVAEGVEAFKLNYTYGTQTVSGPPTLNESPELLLVGQEEPNGFNEFRVSSNEWVGEYFRPTLPVGTTAWSITRVIFQARNDGPTDGRTAVQLRPAASGNTPAATVLAGRTMLESGLSSAYLWQEFSFTGVTGLSPGDGVCLVLKYVSGGARSSRVAYQAKASTTVDTHLVQTTDGGATWSASTSDAMLFYVYGTITAPFPSETTTAHLAAVDISLRPGPDTATRVATSVAILNRPEVILP